MTPDQGHRLTGGFVNEVILKDGSVRRPVGPHSAFVHRLLTHFERHGWHGAPRFLGIDEAGREMLSHVEGHVPVEAHRSAYAESDASLTRLAELVRACHDLAADPALSGAAETVCHNDLDPRNTVYAAAHHGAPPLAFLDWDLAAPGPRIHDVAHLCWQFLRLGTAVTDLPETARRLRLLADAYGLDRDQRRGQLIDTVLWWQDRCWRGIEAEATAGDPAKRHLRALGVPTAIRADHHWVTRHRARLAAAL